MSWDLVVPDDAWEEAGHDEGDRSRLYLSGVTINGCPMHVEAIAVQRVATPKGWDAQEAPEWEDAYEAMVTLAGEPDFVTVTIRGQSYVVSATPHCN